MKLFAIGFGTLAALLLIYAGYITRGGTDEEIVRRVRALAGSRRPPDV
jgi:hypothetical protein